MTYDLSVPGQLLSAFAPDMLLMGGAMVLLLWAAWRDESESHQRSVGVASIVLCVTVIIAIAFYIARGATTRPRRSNHRCPIIRPCLDPRSLGPWWRRMGVGFWSLGTSPPSRRGMGT